MSDLSSNAQTQTVGLVKSGSGTPVVPLSNVSSNQYINDPALLNLVSYSTQNTRPTQISRATLDAADKNYTTAMNNLGSFWASGDTSSGAYADAKANALKADKTWQLARDGLEEVTSNSKANLSSSDSGLDDDWFASVMGSDMPGSADLSGTADELVPSNGDAVDDGSTNGPDIVVTGSKVDHRVRISAKSANADVLYGPSDGTGVMSPLRATNGVIFPYTPIITMAHTANYSQMAPVHANTDYFLYTNTPAVQVQISGQFSAQNETEARYLIAAMHFFRTVTKMHFGEDDDNKGLPPPIVVLSGHGDFMLNNLSGIVTSFSMDLPNNVDYIEIEVDGHKAFVPALTTFNITFIVQQTPKKQREFNFDQFASGELMTSSGWI